ncbi:hypothetical protein C8R44DRAFT_167051 [Mycena epipterygia]|nr:hypothetical protein C8R44DRAFT_167051 [Mycena epipterygia]
MHHRIASQTGGGGSTTTITEAAAAEAEVDVRGCVRGYSVACVQPAVNRRTIIITEFFCGMAIIPARMIITKPPSARLRSSQIFLVPPASRPFSFNWPFSVTPLAFLQPSLPSAPLRRRRPPIRVVAASCIIQYRSSPKGSEFGGYPASLGRKQRRSDVFAAHLMRACLCLCRLQLVTVPPHPVLVVCQSCMYAFDSKPRCCDHHPWSKRIFCAITRHLNLQLAYRRFIPPAPTMPHDPESALQTTRVQPSF